MLLHLDIETIGTTDPAVIVEIAAGIAPPGNISKAETIAAWEAEKKPGLVEEAVRKTSFDGGLGHVICFGYAVDDDDPQAIIGVDECDLLTQVAGLFPPRTSLTCVGHNVGWDIRFLWQRFVVIGIVPPSWLRSAVRAKPWEMADTMLMWNPERDRKVGLDRLCRMLGVPSPKGDMDGSKVWDAYRAGEIQKIAEYCVGDVLAMRECYRRMAA